MRLPQHVLCADASLVQLCQHLISDAIIPNFCDQGCCKTKSGCCCQLIASIPSTLRLPGRYGLGYNACLGLAGVAAPSAAKQLVSYHSQVLLLQRGHRRIAQSSKQNTENPSTDFIDSHLQLFGSHL